MKTTETTAATTGALTADEANAALDAEMSDADRAYWAEAERVELANSEAAS